MAFKRGKFTCANRDGSQEQAEGYISGNMRVHKDKFAGKWAVIHLPSGACLCYLDKLPAAKEVAELMGPLLPTEGTIGKLPPLTEEMHKAGQVLNQWLTERKMETRYYAGQQGRA